MINQQLIEIIKKEPFSDIIGQENVKNQVKSALIANHHLLIVGSPGIGKTTLAKNLAKILPKTKVNDCPFHCSPDRELCPHCQKSKPKTKTLSGQERFVRIQGSPDLTVEDILGDIDPVKAMKYGPLSLKAFTPGKIFKANKGILFFDELNRAPEKLQNALLQVLQEGKATLSSYDVDFNLDFIFIATMNPKDTSTENLSDVMLDRFDVVYMSHPQTTKKEQDIVLKKGKSIVNFPPQLLSLSIEFIRYLRKSDQLEKIPSVRASLSLYERAQTNALLNKKEKVSFDDITAVLISCLAHRIELKPNVKYLHSPQDLIKEKFKEFIEKNYQQYQKEGDYL